MKVEKYNAAKLEEFLVSDLYRDMPYLPVSEQRALSWIKNPRLDPGDIIMYLGFEGDEMLAYRCILPDRYGDVRFGWLSGSWVRPDMRRIGLATELFEEAYRDWGHQLMFTNYAPEAKAVFDKSGRFELYMESPGSRYYLRSSSAGLLGGRRTVYRRSRILLSMADGILNLIQDARSGLNRERTEDLVYEELDSPDLESIAFLEKNGDTGFCRRSLEDFDWIISFPWMKTGREKDLRYFFSSISPRFRNIILKYRGNSGEMNAFAWMVLNGEKMTLPYISADPSALPGLSRIINHYLQENRVSYLTVYQSPILQSLHPRPILLRRNMVQKYFATRDLRKQLPDPETLRFQDGDGDVVFI
jgi:GNAT superfamily N-acetyltransferase